MPIYSYQLRKKDGQIHESRVEASSKSEAVSLIKKSGEHLLEIKSKPISSAFSILKKQAKMNAFERINFTDHLASLIKAGTPIREALEVYADDKSKKSEMIDNIIKTIEQGKKLSFALTSYPQIFSPLYLSLVRAGEAAGNLDETLDYLASELRRENEFIQKVKSAMFYPALVLIVAFMVITLIVMVVIPKINQITRGLSGDMPQATQLIMVFSDLLVKYRFLIILLMFSSIIGMIAALKIKRLREVTMAKLLGAPMVGNLMKKYILARFTRTISSSIKYGLPLSTAFDSVQDIVNNIRYKAAVKRIGERIERGVSLSDAISVEGVFLFPSILSRTIRGAEKTGGLDMALERLSTQYEIEIDRELKRITTLIEPILVIILGIVVLGIAISVIAPIYQITSRIR